MRKLVLVLVTLPFIAALGHDIYYYSENQEKGFGFSDIGWLWDHYEKASHDNWKGEVDEVAEQIGEVIGEKPSQEDDMPIENGQPVLQNEDGTVTVLPKEEKTIPSSKIVAKNVKGFMGFLLQQKAVAVTGVFALFFYILLWLTPKLFTRKSQYEEVGGLVGTKGKDGSYKYNRK